MCIYRRIAGLFYKPKKWQDEKAIDFFADFVVGKISAEEFFDAYKTDETLRNTLIYDKKVKRFQAVEVGGETNYIMFSYSYGKYTPETLVNGDWKDISCLHSAFMMALTFLNLRKKEIPRALYNDDEKKYERLYQMLPYWVYTANADFLQKIYDSAPDYLSKAQKKKWRKKKAFETFKFDDKKPHWEQGPGDWPIENDVPYVFSHREIGDEYSIYYFYHPEDRSRQIVIEQYW